nr:DnaJ domain, zinc finger, CCHC-type, tetratricopeptide-like helical domain protein [Tanacetum cinerariifolium]
MDGVGVRLVKEVAVGVDAFTDEEYVSQFKLYKEFISIASIDKAWTFKSPNGILHSYKFFTVKGLALCLSNVISEDSDGGLNVECAPFPNKVTGASLSMPSPSGSKLLASELDEIEAKFFEKISALERKYQILYEPLYSKRYDIVNGVVEVDGVKDEAETGATNDNAKEAMINLKVANNIKQSAEFLQLKTFESATNGMEIVTEALSVSCYSKKLLKLKREALFQLHKYEEVLQMCEQTLAIAEKNYDSINERKCQTEEPSLYSAANVYELLQIKGIEKVGIRYIEFKKTYDKASPSPHEASKFLAISESGADSHI